MADLFAAWDAKKTTPTIAFTDTPATPNRDLSKYAAAALESELANVRNAPHGSRNHQLNVSAVKLGHLVASGVLDLATVRDHLGRADTRAGDNGRVAWATIDSGLAHGTQQAKIIPDREVPPWLAPEPTESSDPFAHLDADFAATTGTASASAGLSTIEAGGHNSPAPDAGELTSSPMPEDSTPSKLSALVRERLPVVDWHHAWTAKTEIEWIVEPLLPARRLVAIYSLPKVGKSLLMLEIAYQCSRGVSVLGVKPERPIRVLYVDFENDLEGDIVPRLRNMGASPGELDNLQYLSLPTISGLDSEQGSQELVAAVDEYRCELVVVDTLSRSVDGDENENDTWLKFYRHTGLKLKQRGVAMIRLDHSGKDESKGQRGGSAKSGDVDAVWRMSRLTDGTDGGVETFRLVCEANRFPIAEKLLTLTRQESPLRHVVKATGARDIIIDAIVRYLDDNDVPLVAGKDRIKLADLKLAVPGASDRTRDESIKLRRARHSQTVDNPVDNYE